MEIDVLGDEDDHDEEEQDAELLPIQLLPTSRNAELSELEKRFPAGLPEMDPVKDMGISDPLVKEAVAEVATLRERVAAAPSAAMSVDAEQLELFEKKAALSEKIAKMEVEKRAGSMVLSFREELKNRSKVLKKLGHISEDGITVTLKGRAACEEAILALRTLKQQLAEAERKLARHVITVEHCLMYLRPGRVVWVREELEAGEVEEWGFGIVVTVVKRTLKGSTKGVPGDDPRAEYVLHTLLHCAPGSASTKPTAASGLGAPGELRPLPVPLSMVVGLGAMRVNIPKDLRSPEARKSVLIQMQHSFLQFQHEKKVPQLEAGIAKYNKELEEMGESTTLLAKFCDSCLTPI
eukprot:gene32101-40590_t